MPDDLVENVGMIVLIALLILFIFGIFVAIDYPTRHDDKVWNDGHCDICGGTWKYEQAVGHKHSTTYIYVCDGCEKRIELYEVR